jgi:hypothetical protein
MSPQFGESLSPHAAIAAARREYEAVRERADKGDLKAFGELWPRARAYKEALLAHVGRGAVYLNFLRRLQLELSESLRGHLSRWGDKLSPEERAAVLEVLKD